MHPICALVLRCAAQGPAPHKGGRIWGTPELFRYFACLLVFLPCLSVSFTALVRLASDTFGILGLGGALTYFMVGIFLMMGASGI